MIECIVCDREAEYIVISLSTSSMYYYCKEHGVDDKTEASYREIYDAREKLSHSYGCQLSKETRWTPQ